MNPLGTILAIITYFTTGVLSVFLSVIYMPYDITPFYELQSIYNVVISLPTDSVENTRVGVHNPLEPASFDIHGSYDEASNGDLNSARYLPLFNGGERTWVEGVMGVPAGPSLYIGAAAAPVAGILAYLLLKRIVGRKTTGMKATYGTEMKESQKPKLKSKLKVKKRNSKTKKVTGICVDCGGAIYTGELYGIVWSINTNGNLKCMKCIGA